MRMYASSVVKPAPLVYIRFNGWRVHRRAPTSALGIPRFVDLAQLVARATHLFWCADSSAKENTGRDNSETVNGERTKVRQGSANWRSGKPMFKRIMVGIDGSQAAIGALAEAIRLGESESATVRAVSVVEPEADTITPFSGFGHPVPVARSLRDAAQAGLARACDLFVLTGVTGETSLIDAGDSDVASVLLRESRAWGADLVVLGTHGRRGIERLLLGSTAETFLRTSVVPVLVIPSPEGVQQGEQRQLKSQ